MLHDYYIKATSKEKIFKGFLECHTTHNVLE